MNIAEVAERLGLSGGSRRRLREVLEQLVLDGTLVALPGERFRAASKALESWEGLLSVHPRGFAFVNAAGKEDVFVPPPGIGAALHGDTVRIGIAQRTARGPEGRVLGIVRRRNPRVSGVLRRRKKSAWLEPDDDRIRGPIVILAGPKGEGRDGDAAVVQIMRFPETADENPEGVLESVFGTPGEPEVEIAKILARDNINEERAADVLSEAAARANELRPISLEGRKDLRKFPLLTIDPVDARDHDDAIYIERRAEGYRAYIAIADVSEYVRAGGAVDRDASERCFTTYLPDRAVPMLPPVLASDHCSLLPGQDRYALCAIVDLDKTASVQRFRLVEAVIHVAARLTYEDVAATLSFIEGEPKNPQALEYKKDLRVLNDLAKKLRRIRMRRGSLDLDLPEPRVELDPDTGRPLSVSRRAKNPGIMLAYQLVEEMMLLANERVARWLSGKKSPAVYRVHAPPDPTRLEQLGLAAQRLGVPFEDDTLDSPMGVSRWMKKIAKHPLRIVLESMLLRSLKMAQYDVVNVGHFGLASESYVHFTSPIRRYPDLLVHAISKALLRGGRVQNNPEEIEALRAKATRSSEIERIVMQAEREVVDVYRCLLMQDKIGQVFEARVTGLAGSGVYAVLDEPFVDVLIRFESLGPDRYEASDDGLSVFGQRSGDRIALGDRITIVIEDVALLRRTTYGRRVPPARVLDAASELPGPLALPVPEPRSVERRGRAQKGKRGQVRRQEPAGKTRGAGSGKRSGSRRQGRGEDRAGAVAPERGARKAPRPGGRSRRPGR
jgi:ribonuclease R